MPVYRFLSGDFKGSRETPCDAEAEALALLFFAEHFGKPGGWGQIVEVSGGQYAGSNSVYVSTRRTAERMGVYMPTGA